MLARRVIAPLGLAACLLVVLALTRWWYLRIVRMPPALSHGGEGWERVKDAYPLIQPLPEPSPFSGEMVKSVLDANPFSPQRRFVPPPPDESSTPSSGESHPPRFLYKGQIKVGARSRAILANAATGKTHFLEVGQEVAGFKVLDISQHQVVLSDTQTHEELVLTLASSAPSIPERPGHRAPSRTSAPVVR